VSTYSIIADRSWKYFLSLCHEYEFRLNQLQLGPLAYSRGEKR